MTLSETQRSKIALATLGLPRMRVGVFALNNEAKGGWQVGVSVPDANSTWPNLLTTIAVVDYEQLSTYTAAIGDYLDQLYKERP